MDIAYTSKCLPPPELDHGDFLAIDDLLDFSNDDIGGPIEPSLSNATSSLTSPPSDIKLEPYVSSQIEKKALPHTPAGVFDSDELCVPCDDLAELEWLSNFVEESFSSADAHACQALGPHGILDEKAASDESFRTTSPVSVLESIAFPREKICSAFGFSPETAAVPGRARSKRCRNAVCFWNTRILSMEPSESLLESSSTNYAISTDSNMYMAYYDHDNDENDDNEADGDGNYTRPAYHHHKKSHNSIPKLKASSKLSTCKPKKFKVNDDAPVRKCLHCATQKTPQWRAGPMGPKTLCNACGVRYKSGRLCEEYRPAASPTFIESVHSNSHRKVLEMRMQRGESGTQKSHKQHPHRLHYEERAESDHFRFHGNDLSIEEDSRQVVST